MSDTADTSNGCTSVTDMGPQIFASRLIRLVHLWNFSEHMANSHSSVSDVCNATNMANSCAGMSDVCNATDMASSCAGVTDMRPHILVVNLVDICGSALVRSCGLLVHWNFIEHMTDSNTSMSDVCNATNMA